MPKISVAIPAYNHERYVARAIQSVLDQTYQDFEIVITDDGSRDGTVEAIRRFSDPRIRLFVFAVNQGASATMNHCIRHARGEYVAILNSDDEFLPEKLEKQVSFLDTHRDVVAVFGLPLLIDETGSEFRDRTHPYSTLFEQPDKSRFEWLGRFFYQGNALCHPSVLIRRLCYEQVGYYDERMAQLPDFDMWVRLCLRYDIAVLPEKLVKFRIDSSESNASGNRPEALVRLAAEHVQVLRQFLHIETPEFLCRVFPAATKHRGWSDKRVIPFVIAMLALETESVAHQQFAISTLFDLLGDEELRDRLREQCGFAPIDFIRLTGKYDLFNLDANAAIRTREQDVRRLEVVVQDAQAELGRIERNLAWRAIKRYRAGVNWALPEDTRRRRLYSGMDAALRVIVNEGWTRLFQHVRDYLYTKYQPYKMWIAANEPQPGQLDAMTAEGQSLAYRPLISIITPVFNPSRYALTQCIQSLLDQTYSNWELCIADGGSDRAYVKDVIEGFARTEPRVKVVALGSNRGIAGNSNEALRLARGEYVGFLDHDDTLAPFALYEVVKALNEDRAIDLLYSDEDKIPSRGTKRSLPQFKSDWAPDTFLSYNYLCHFAVARKALVDTVGGFRSAFEGSQDYDLILRIVEKTTRIKHIAKVLYHWRSARVSVAAEETAKPYAFVAGKKAIAEHLDRRGLDAEVLDGVAPGLYRVKYRLRPGQRVSVIIPTKDKAQLLERCVSSVLTKTDYPDYEILIIDNQSREQETGDFFERVRSDGRVRILPYDRPFNFSAINNCAVRATTSEVCVFLNNDTEVINPDWLRAMLEFAQRGDVGAVGAKLFYPNDTIQHAGTIVGYWGVADHAHQRFPRSARGYMWRIQIVQNLSAVTAACMMVRRKVFDEVGGYDEQLSHAFNDVDLCLKMREKGYLIVYTPYAELYHHESVSRGRDTTPEQKVRLAQEVALIKDRWRGILEAGDPYYSPNLTLEKYDFSLRL